MTNDEFERVTQDFIAAVDAQVAWGTPRAEVEAWLRQVSCLCSKGPERDAALLDFLFKREATIIDRDMFVLVPPEAWRRPDAPAEPSSPALAPGCRLKIEGEVLEEHGQAVVRLDGQAILLETSRATRQAQLCLLRHLLNAGGEWRTRRDLSKMEQDAPCWLRRHERRWERQIQKLPERLRDLIEVSDKGLGYRLCPAIWPG
jgi:hypothetical protein